LPSLFETSELYDLIKKVEKGERLDRDAGIRMMKSQDILALGSMANIVRERKNGNQTIFMVNQPFNDANVYNATMPYGNTESTEERIDRLLQLRALQDQTGQYLSFIPLAYYPEDALLLEGTMGVGTTTGLEDLKLLAISRILLDNFDHIKVFWTMLGLKLTQVSLAFGVDVIEGNGVKKPAMVNIIQKAGRDAMERDGLGGSPCKRRP